MTVGDSRTSRRFFAAGAQPRIEWRPRSGVAQLIDDGVKSRRDRRAPLVSAPFDELDAAHPDAVDRAGRRAENPGVENAVAGASGEPGMGAIDEPFDHECIRLFGAGDDKALTDYLERELPRTGNGGHEVRNWVIAHGAAGSRGFELIAYEPVPEVYVGCGYAAWRVAA